MSENENERAPHLSPGRGRPRPDHAVRAHPDMTANLPARGRPPLRMTPQRQAVLAAVRASDDHPRAAEIYARVRRDLPRIAFGTVYNALNALADHGIIRQLSFGDAASRFDARTDRHDHAVCTRCGSLADIHAAPPPSAVRAVAERTGFAIHEHHTQLLGLCAACQARAEAEGQL